MRDVRRERLVREAKTNLSAFTKLTFETVSPGTVYNHNWHIDAISEYLTACTTGEIKRLIINMPPRSLKSISTSIAWPAWLLGRNPSEQIMVSSYSAALSMKHSVDTRLTILSDWYQYIFPEVQLAHDQNEKGKFQTTRRGHRIATSVGGTATGEGGNFLITDDPTNPVQAQSDTERTTANTWFDQTFSTRQNDRNTGVMVVVMQRLHEDDLTGHLLEKGGWEHLCLQARSEKKTIIEIGNFRKQLEIGELLDPLRLNSEVLDRAKSDLGAYGYAGQYQQNPAPTEGGILKKAWWRPWPKNERGVELPLPECDFVLQSIDTAFGEKQQNDCSAITTWGLFQSVGNDGIERTGCILLDMEYGHWGFPELKTKVLKSYNSHQPDRVIIEAKASGQSLIQELRKLGIPVRPFKIERGDDKVYRANVSTPMLEKGHVWFVDRDWSHELIEHCMPSGTMIFTIEGLVEIENIRVGDMVLTHEGRFRPVTSVMSRMADEIVSLEGKSLDVMKLTPGHPLYTMMFNTYKKPTKPTWVKSEDIIPRRYARAVRDGKVYSEATQSPSHAAILPIIRTENEISKIDLRDWIKYGKSRNYGVVESEGSISTTHVRINSMQWEQNLDYDFGMFIGLFIAEGCVSRNRISWSFNAKTEEHLVSFIKRIAKERLGDMSVWVEYTKNNSVNVCMSSALLKDFFLEMGKNAPSKRIAPWMFDANKDFLRGLVDGWISGDGHVDKNDTRKISCTSVSHTLIWQMRMVLLMLGVHSTLSKCRRNKKALLCGRLVNQRDSYTLRWINDSSYSCAVLTPEVALFSIMKKSKSEESCMVYNMSVMEDESYVTTGGTVHNCASFPQGRIKDTVDTVTQALIYIRKWRWLNMSDENSATSRDPDYSKPTARRLYGGGVKK